MKTIFCKRFFTIGLFTLLALSIVIAGCGSTQDTNAPEPQTSSQEDGESTERTTESVQEAWKPTQPIEYIAPANPGGGWDTLA